MSKDSVATLAVDVGDVRVGIALGDPTGLLASPLTILKRGPGCADEIAGLVKQHRVGRVLVGLPLNTDGTRGFQARKVERFAEVLSEMIAPVPVLFEDEGFSTQDARQLRIDRGVRKKKRRERVDAEAAALFLQAWLDRQPRGAWTAVPSTSDDAGAAS